VDGGCITSLISSISLSRIETVVGLRWTVLNGEETVAELREVVTGFF
jgi:hypothetical protein